MTDVVIRADASLAIGHGHVMRCLTLAEALRDRGAGVRFVCREHPGHLCDMIAERGFAVSRLPAPVKQSLTDTATHDGWLGATWQVDAEQTRSAIEASGARPDWLVVDHYALDQRWETFLCTSATRILVIDDLADRAHACDLLLDQNLVGHMHQRYADKVPEQCGMLLGPEYALLQPIYAELHDRVPARESPIRGIFIFFGGADSANLTGLSLAAFLRLNRPDIDVDVVITAGSPHAETIHDQVARHSNIHLHSNLPTLAPLMAKADLAIGAGGATSWERLCLGLPALVITSADNQRPIAESLAKRSLIRWLGHQDTVDESTIALALSDMIEKGLEEGWSLRCLEVIDGRGANRVCELLIIDENIRLRVRHATWMDEAILLEWANDPITRRNAFSSDPISPGSHREWFLRRLRDMEGCRLYIVETLNGLAIGQVRFDRKDLVWEVDYAVAPILRGRGLGRPVLEAALLKLKTCTRGDVILGKVKSSNHPSQSVFNALGFISQSIGESVIEFRRML